MTSFLGKINTNQFLLTERENDGIFAIADDVGLGIAATVLLALKVTLKVNPQV